jgi:hypothetical protein
MTLVSEHAVKKSSSYFDMLTHSCWRTLQMQLEEARASCCDTCMWCRSIGYDVIACLFETDV